MPSSAEHQTKCAGNRGFLDAGNGGRPLTTADGGWAATVAFYAALHLVERPAAGMNLYFQSPDAHRVRLQACRAVSDDRTS